MLQLTGFSDPVYAEAHVTVHQYDIVMDVTVINRTHETLQNVCLELATMGDLKLVERPQNYSLAPGDTKVIRANIKVRGVQQGLGGWGAGWRWGWGWGDVEERCLGPKAVRAGTSGGPKHLTPPLLRRRGMGAAAPLPPGLRPITGCCS